MKRLWRLQLLVGVVALGLFATLPTEAARAIVYQLVSGLAVAAIVVGVIGNRPARPFGWSLVAVGWSLFFVGDALFNIYELVLGIDPFPSVADVFYLAGYPFVGWGVAVLIRRKGRSNLPELLDVAVITIGLSLVLWTFVIEPTMQGSAADPLERAASSAYPLADVVLIAIGVRLLVGGARRTVAYAQLAASLVVMLLADGIFGLVELSERALALPNGAELSDPVYIVSNVLMGAAVLHPSMRSLSDETPPPAGRLTWARLATLASASLMAPAMLQVQALRGRPTTVVGVVGAAVLFVLVVARMAGLIRALEQAQGERRRLLDKTVQAAEDERKRVALELHDGPIQRLTEVGFDLERAARLMERGKTDRGREVLSSSQTRLGVEVEGLRGIMAALRPPVLDEVGLEAAVLDWVVAFGRESHLNCEVRTELRRRLDPELETTLYRVVQEALANVRKHAAASRVWVSLHARDERTELVIRDDGVGFDPEAINPAGRDGFGLLGMRERVQTAGGNWAVHARPGAGVTVTATFVHREALV
jgi:signal transduction histidine kinase